MICNFLAVFLISSYPPAKPPDRTVSTKVFSKTSGHTSYLYLLKCTSHPNPTSTNIDSVRTNIETYPIQFPKTRLPSLPFQWWTLLGAALERKSRFPREQNQGKGREGNGARPPASCNLQVWTGAHVKFIAKLFPGKTLARKGELVRCANLDPVVNPSKDELLLCAVI